MYVQRKSSGEELAVWEKMVMWKIVEIPQGEAERAFKDETLSKVGCDQGQGCQAQ